MKLTNATVSTLAYAEADNKADLRFDDDLKGFGVRIYPKGRRFFFISYRNAFGTKCRYTIGEHGVFSATEARNLARDKLADVRRGIDPQAERREQRAEMTFADFAKRYMDHFRHHKRSWEDDQQRLDDHLLPKLRARKLSEITTQQCQHIHTSIKEALSPATANRVMALLRHMLNMAVRWKLLAASPAQGMQMFREPPPRDIVLIPDECRRLFDACDADTNVHAAALFKLAMLTGRRVGELLGAKWEHFNASRSLLTLPLTKAGERQFVYLNEAAAAVLRTLPRIECESACKKDPAFGVIGVQKGPLSPVG